MNTTVKSLGIDQLSLAERILLVEEIWDGIAEDSQPLEIPASHRAELDRRLDAPRTDPREGFTWEEVKASLLGRSEQP